MKKTGVLWAGLVVVVLIAFLVAAGCDTGKTGSAGKAKLFFYSFLVCGLCKSL